MTPDRDAPPDERLLREERARLVTSLSRRFGVGHLDAIEDAAQHALLSAVVAWPRDGRPASPAAWLTRVATNHLTSELRRRARHGELDARELVGLEDALAPATPVLRGEVQDDLLRTLFLACDDPLPVESQLVFALSALSGFDVRAIAARLFTTEANVHKRLSRTRAHLVERAALLDALPDDALVARVPAVRTVLYVMFTEGYLGCDADRALRVELCDEALRLATALAEDPRGATPETFALVALMHLHRARMSARVGDDGALLLLEEQDRARFDHAQIHEGLQWLARSAQGDDFTRFHAEAGIAAEHCLAPSFGQTRWERIISLYELLERVAPSPTCTLQRAVAVAEARGPEAGLAVLEGLAPPSWLLGSHLWSAVAADLHRRAGHAALAHHHREAALAAAPSEAVRRLIKRRLAADLTRSSHDDVGAFVPAATDRLGRSMGPS